MSRSFKCSNSLVNLQEETLNQSIRPKRALVKRLAMDLPRVEVHQKVLGKDRDRVIEFKFNLLSQGFQTQVVVMVLMALKCKTASKIHKKNIKKVKLLTQRLSNLKDSMAINPKVAKNQDSNQASLTQNHWIQNLRKKETCSLKKLLEKVVFTEGLSHQKDTDFEIFKPNSLNYRNS